MDQTPGQKALSVMKNLEKSCVEFKTPNAPTKKLKQKILTEEKYIEELSKIIQRDFFPDLEKLKAQNDYIDAIDKNDIVKLREIYSKYNGRTPKSINSFRRQSPATFETPASNASSTPHLQSGSENSKKGADEATTDKDDSLSTSSIADNYTLDSFLSKYTSEDNYSFQEIIDAADVKLKQKFSVLYNHELLSADKLSKALTLPSIEKQFTDDDTIKPVETWNYKNKNYIMYVPDGAELTKEEKMEMANRKQEIVYTNTRLRGNPFNENQNKETISELAKTQSQNLTGKIGVDGNVLQNSTDSPKVRGFNFVKTPSPCPGEACSPFMTWGEIEGTPFRLDGSDTPIRHISGPSFKINEASRRETIAIELADKARERMRSQKQKALDTARKNIGTPHLRSTTDRLASMSPAARHLATMKLGLRSSLLTPSVSVAGKTPLSPMIRRKTPSNIAKQSLEKSQSSSNILSNTEQSDITNDLLKIPSKRPKASDFF